MQWGWYDRRTRRARDLPVGPWRVYLDFEVRRMYCRSCQAVKREALGFLADNGFHTKRFAYYVGRRCRDETVSSVAQELHLDWHSVKTLDMQYMRAHATQKTGASSKARSTPCCRAGRIWRWKVGRRSRRCSRPTRA